mmetsp:Transcript_14897/g.21021  ORF Transcript_14897/g.21021 Transcript_14897/m.21021 type:complete len:281 (+) Transcript_14897:104-946(+)|eukprot:CAMPEP_0175158252 /NCGR_PEP_ID=MMETSP0087-20121206/22703_1 /TAXON_ID=136419 /ORGANISM="Unknown Unknown, Strain D1" /LENGTH=280 /DNA_ID=CAMNT_0016446049 /DNA_START=153 /DNA_END=995 /DNA_ORIENTATION=+
MNWVYSRDLFSVSSDVLATAVISEAAPASLKLVAHLVDLLNRDRGDISDMLAAAVVTEAATTGLVIVAFFVVVNRALFASAASAAGSLVTFTLGTVAIFFLGVFPSPAAGGSAVCFLFGAGVGEAGVVGAMLETAVVAVGALPISLEVSAHPDAAFPGFLLGFRLLLFLFLGNVLAQAFFAEGTTAFLKIVANLLGNITPAFRVEPRVIFAVHETAAVTFGAVPFLEFEALPGRSSRHLLNWFPFAVFEAALIAVAASSIVSEIAAHLLGFRHTEKHSIK